MSDDAEVVYRVAVLRTNTKTRNGFVYTKNAFDEMVAHCQAGDRFGVMFNALFDVPNDMLAEFATLSIKSLEREGELLYANFSILDTKAGRILRRAIKSKMNPQIGVTIKAKAKDGVISKVDEFVGICINMRMKSSSTE